MNRRATIVAMVAASLALTACGGSSSNDTAPAVSPATTGTPATEPSPEPTAPPETTVDESTTAEPTSPTIDEPGEGPTTTESQTTEPEPEPQQVWPDDGCSPDNSPTPAADAEGPAPTIEVRPESADGPLPDLAVRRINCKGGWENLRNELPSDRALLVWFWAPH